MGNSSSSSSSAPQRAAGSQQRSQNQQGGEPAYQPSRVYAPQSHAGGSYNGAYSFQHAMHNYHAGSFQHHQMQARSHQQQSPAVPQPQELTTQTLKNQVNLKKDSISVDPLEGDPSKLRVTFRFDATAACRVSVFVNARDGAERNSLVYDGEAIGVSLYEAGINQEFPVPGGSVAQLSSTATGKWGSMPAGSYALAIRLEALTDAGRAEGQSLDFVEAGGELPTWVQSQTTYVQLVLSDSGAWLASHVLQKLWINGSTFELQEIYGLEPSRGGPADDGDVVDGVVEDDGGNECVICMSAIRDTMSLPCRHMCMCHGCADELKMQTNKCPICRNVVSSLLHIKVGGNRDEPGSFTGASGGSGTRSGAAGTSS